MSKARVPVWAAGRHTPRPAQLPYAPDAETAGAMHPLATTPVVPRPPQHPPQHTRTRIETDGHKWAMWVQGRSRMPVHSSPPVQPQESCLCRCQTLSLHSLSRQTTQVSTRTVDPRPQTHPGLARVSYWHLLQHPLQHHLLLLLRQMLRRYRECGPGPRTPPGLQSPREQPRGCCMGQDTQYKPQNHLSRS